MCGGTIDLGDTNYEKWQMFTWIFTAKPMDYIGLSSILNFAACETRQCVEVTIVDDTPNEPVEEFDITLERTVGLDTRIKLLPMDARVVIYDEKSKSVIKKINDLITVSKACIILNIYLLP